MVRFISVYIQFCLTRQTVYVKHVCSGHLAAPERIAFLLPTSQTSSRFTETMPEFIATADQTAVRLCCDGACDPGTVRWCLNLISHGACVSVATWGHYVQKLLFAPCHIANDIAITQRVVRRARKTRHARA